MSIPLGRLRVLLVGAASVLGIGLMGIALLVSSMPDRMMYDEVVQENLRLKARLQQIERTMDEANETLRRLRLYDTRLRDLQPEGFPGFGPLEVGELEAAGLTETPLEMSGIGMFEPSELGIPMDELGGEELVPVVDGSALAWAQELH
ncbi:MAG: hypothetical protein QGG40_22225, partial [Myxococcota bacterium]|nr:hypothetical protein [Myxococcota bacterium]